ncbi:MAG: hypothetical protein ACYCXQ_00850 [Candidatus Humimicrobiaceae bacterium]
MKKATDYRHGDIYLKRIEDIPKGLNVKNITVLAEGEATGHLHQFMSPVKAYTKTEDIDARFLEIMSDVDLTHPEHNTIAIAPGKYEVHREQEFDYFTEEIRRVAD